MNDDLRPATGCLVGTLLAVGFFAVVAALTIVFTR